MNEEEKFSDDPAENLRIENELMKIKLKARYGDAFQMGSSEALPPEMENQFLKNILAFEENNDGEMLLTVHERIGKPAFKPAAEMNDGEMESASGYLLQLMRDHKIQLDFCDGPYDNSTIYRFITEEFFEFAIGKEPPGGMVDAFIYEEFYPNHKKEIEKCVHDFLQHFFTRSFNEDSFEIGNEITTAEGVQLSRQELLEKMKLFFDAFNGFTEDGYTIEQIDFELDPAHDGGMGFGEGVLKYKALLDNNEFICFEGPYKLYMQLQYDYWSVFYFVVPGFKW